jgi:DNA-binding response OmpR family regulator
MATGIPIPVNPLALLHIDDSPGDRFFFQQAARLANTPFAIYAAAGAQSAAPHFATWSAPSGTGVHPRPSLVLLDYDMGDHNGADFLHWLRLVRRASIPVVMLTRSTDEAVVRKCYSAGANHFLTKPASINHAIAMIIALYRCMASDPPQFASLAALPEYMPNPLLPPAAASPQSLL